MRILGDGRVRYSAWTVPGLQPLVVDAGYQVLDVDDRVVESTSTYEVLIRWVDRPMFLVSVVRHRVEEAQFTYNLTPEQLRDAVSTIRRLGGGVETWITPGLERMRWGLLSMEMEESKPERRALLAVIPGLLRSVRSIPIPKSWWTMRRQWERWKREKAREKRRKR